MAMWDYLQFAACGNVCIPQECLIPDTRKGQHVYHMLPFHNVHAYDGLCDQEKEHAVYTQISDSLVV